MAVAPTKPDQWQKIYGCLLGNQAAWVADVGPTAELVRAIVDARPDGVAEDALAGILGYDGRYVRVWWRSASVFEYRD